jgi:two-component system, LytTR family, response regulator
MIRTLLVDDEPLAREGLRLLLQGEADVEIVGEAADGAEAIRMVRTLDPDLLLLDVQMLGIDGFEVLRRLAGGPIPAVVFVSAFDQFAIRAFEVHALDYLLKPPSRERLGRALHRVRDAAAREDPAGAIAIRDLLETFRPPAEARGLERLVVRDRQHFLLLPVQEVTRLEAAGNYIEVHARGRTYLIRGTMNALEQQLDPEQFARIHRSTIVKISEVTRITPDGSGDFLVMLADGVERKLTRAHRERLMPRPAARSNRSV